jgi:UDP-glucose:(heptosyl)LPS alpha-1,3-glucosyltransferase
MSQDSKPRIAVVSPFIDRSHGTELIVTQWIEYLAAKFEVHIYSERVRHLDAGKFVWHRVPGVPGPHLFRYVWWFLANQIQRAIDRNFRGLRYDLVFSPGINCFDAELITVHVVFADYAQRNAHNLRLSRRSLREWPALIHRKLYYRLVMFLERRIYTRPNTMLVSLSRKTSYQVADLFGRSGDSPLIYAGLDQKRFNPQGRLSLRARARKEMGIAENSFALLLIGNDWRNKGVPVLLQALAEIGALTLELLFVSREDIEPVRAIARDQKLERQIHFLPPRNDIEFYYAAADAYVGPSLEDSYALPPAEAMACGLPVIVSEAAGVSEIISDGVDGLILRNPADAAALARMIRRLYEDNELRNELGKNAARTAQGYTWERSGAGIEAIFEQILGRKTHPVADTLAEHF